MTRLSIIQRSALGLIFAAALPAAPVQWTAAMGGNDNWYEYVPSISIFQGVSFDAARAAATASTHLGLPGYLATITSAGEQAFIETSFPFLVGFGATGTAHLGASDAEEEGVFRWLDGPEAGQEVAYTKWWPGHPTGTGDTLALYIFLTSPPPAYGWVDNFPSALGYVIEYGDGVVDASTSPVPEPSALLLSAAGLAVVALRRR